VFIDRSRFESNVLLTRTAAGNTVAKVFDSSDLSEIRVDLGIRASDALLKGGGNCAVLVEGSPEEDGLPVFMEMIGLSEFELGIAIVNMGGSDFQKSKSIIQLLKGYDIPCVVILDLDAQATKEDLERMKGEHLSNLEHVHCWKKGTIEDYYPTSVVAQVINQEFSPATPVEAHELNGTWSGKERLENYKRIMFEHQAGSSLEYLKKALGGIGTRMLRAEGAQPDEEIQGVLQLIAAVARR
jgi:hypothetical protein